MFNYSGQPGLLGYQQPQYGGLLGTQNLMQQYLMNLYMRRYQPPAIQQQPGMVGSQMGQGGMQYQAPQIANVSPVATQPQGPAGWSGAAWAAPFSAGFNNDGQRW